MVNNFLLITPSYRRPYMLRSAILNANQQSNSSFVHSIAINQDEVGEFDYTPIIDDVVDLQKTYIQYHKNSYQHQNYKNAIEQVDYTKFDYIVKWDDDDIYKKDYLKELDAYLSENPDCDVYSCSLSLCINNWHMDSKGTMQNLGGMPKFVGMPQSLCFSQRAIKEILSWNDEKFQEIGKEFGGFEDTKYVGELNKQGFVFAKDLHSRQLIWHIHGGHLSGQGNVSTGAWSRLKWDKVSDTWEFHG